MFSKKKKNCNIYRYDTHIRKYVLNVSDNISSVHKHFIIANATVKHEWTNRIRFLCCSKSFSNLYIYNLFRSSICISMLLLTIN